MKKLNNEVPKVYIYNFVNVVYKPLAKKDAFFILFSLWFFFSLCLIINYLNVISITLFAFGNSLVTYSVFNFVFKKENKIKYDFYFRGCMCLYCSFITLLNSFSILFKNNFIGYEILPIMILGDVLFGLFIIIKTKRKIERNFYSKNKKQSSLLWISIGILFSQLIIIPLLKNAGNIDLFKAIFLYLVSILCSTGVTFFMKGYFSTLVGKDANDVVTS